MCVGAVATCSSLRPYCCRAPDWSDFVLGADDPYERLPSRRCGHRARLWGAAVHAAERVEAVRRETETRRHGAQEKGVACRDHVARHVPSVRLWNVGVWWCVLSRRCGDARAVSTDPRRVRHDSEQPCPARAVRPHSLPKTTPRQVQPALRTVSRRGLTRSELSKRKVCVAARPSSSARWMLQRVETVRLGPRVYCAEILSVGGFPTRLISTPLRGRVPHGPRDPAACGCGWRGTVATGRRRSARSAPPVATPRPGRRLPGRRRG